MKTLREKQKEEAIKRMQMLRLMPNVIAEFKESGTIYYSERQSSFFNAVLYWVRNNPEWEREIKEFEKRNGVLVYHAQLTHLEFGDSLCLFYVAKDPEEWERERKDIQDHEIFIRDLINEEYGYIGIKPSMGGVARTY